MCLSLCTPLLTSLFSSFRLTLRNPAHAAEPCPVNTAGTNVPTGDCAPDPGYHGVPSATTTAPYFATYGVNGANVQLCSTQVGCEVDTAMTCTTGADQTKLQCTTLERGYSADANFMVSGELQFASN